MKKVLLIALVINLAFPLISQNIEDNKVSFTFIQLPYQKIDDAFKTYEIRATHSYQIANQDSIALTEMRNKAALDYFYIQLKSYQVKKDSLDIIYLQQMANWEKAVNSVPTGTTPPPQPMPPVYPEAPKYPELKNVRLHSDYPNENFNKAVKLDGFQEGLGGVLINLELYPISNIQIISNKKGSGSSTKYEYSCRYTLPVKITLESPTQGTMLSEIIGQSAQIYKLQDFSSKYEFELYMKKNEDAFYANLEAQARSEALKSANQLLNSQFGYVETLRNTEIYSVKKFKDYDYSDVTKAYTTTIQACNLVKNDRNRSGAQAKIDAAIQMWKEILQESNTYDEKARINDKITAMIYINLAELNVWKADFDEADININLAINSGVGKAKRFAEDLQHFVSDQRKRWSVHY